MTGPTRTGSRPPAGARFTHDAVLFDDDEAFVERAVAHLVVGADAGNRAVVACNRPRRELLVGALDGRVDDVAVVENGYDAWSALATAESYVGLTRRACAAGSTGVCVVGELPEQVWRYPRTWTHWSRYEAVVNHALADLPFHALCAYDLRDTPPQLLDAVRQTHHHLAEPSTWTVNLGYTEPTQCLRNWADPTYLPVESAAPMLEVRDIDDPRTAREARHRLGRLLAHLDTALVSYADHLPPADPSLTEVEDYLQAVSEVLTNAVTHGGGHARLRVWVMHDQVVTTVTDLGPGFDDPFAGYVLDRERLPRPIGLWLARQLCDELSWRRDADGFTVRLRADLDVRAP